MEMPHSIKALVQKIKEEMFSSVDLYNFVSPSAYDTAWLAMIPDPQRLDRPMFQGCLDWVLKNQNENGFWGESHVHEALIDSLPATLACMVSLKMWDIGTTNIEKGLAFIHGNAEKLLTDQYDRCPRWFAIVFPAMVELARKTGLEVVFPDCLEGAVKDIFVHRQRILEMEELADKYHCHPLISYIETLPPSYDIQREDILQHLSEDGSLFQSPSATASAFMATGNRESMVYLESLVQRCGSRVPPMYPMDEQLVKLCMVNQIQRLGLAEHFIEETEDILEQAYRNYMNQESQATGIRIAPTKIYKDSLAFRLMRMQGYRVSPWRFCWFLRHEDLLAHIEKNCEYFFDAMFNVYKATDLMFPEENELQEARLFSKKLLGNALSMRSTNHNLAMFLNCRRMIENELRVPWLAQMDHLEHRMWIEENEMNALWMGKASFYRLPCLHNDALLRLAVENYRFRQSIYRNELEELKRWSKDWGLIDMGFGREKTAYCYFAIASSSSIPYNFDIRMAVAKSAIIVTVADDFFDMKGSLEELKCLTEAVRRWEGKNLTSHSKVIFDVLDNLVCDIVKKHLDQEGHDITKIVRDLWYEAFASWMVEAEWSRNSYIPTFDEYLEIGMTSVSIHTMVLPPSSLMNPSLPNYTMKHGQYGTITKLLMVSTRLLNDIQSYQKELEDGKMNPVLIYLNENPEAGIEDSIAFIGKILDEKKKDLLEHVLMDDIGDMPKSCKQLHLSFLKVFQMFFNSTNGFDSDTEMLHHINKAIYLPI